MAAPHHCIICGERILQQIKFNGRGDLILHWELLSMESFRLLFGLPAVNIDDCNSSMKEESRRKMIECRELCNRCVQDVENVKYVFWQLHSLEARLTQLQDLIFQRLAGNYEAIPRSELAIKVEEVDDGVTAKMEYDERVKCLFEDVQGRRADWPGGNYFSKWREAKRRCDYYVSKDETDAAGEDDLGNFELDNNYTSDVSNSDSDWECERVSKAIKSQKRKVQKSRNCIAMSALRKSSKMPGMKKQARTVSFHGISGPFQFLCGEDPSMCSRAYKTRKDLNKHIKQFHKGRTHACDHDGCGEKFLSLTKLSVHKNRIHGIEEKKHCCDVNPVVCSMEFSSRVELRAHVKEVHPDQLLLYTCNYNGCTEKFESRGRRDWHKTKAHGINLKKDQRSCVCEICGLSLRIKHLKRHLQSKHLNHGSFTCDRCSMEFPDSDQLSTHGTLHDQMTVTFPFACVLPDCHQVFTNSLALKKHVISSHLSDRVKCSTCGIFKPNQYLLNIHVKTHQEKNVACDECPKRFVTLSKLKSHKRDYHSGNKYTCEVCRKEFTLKVTFEIHQKSHLENEKRFKCAICPKMFSNKFLLKNHEEIHSGTKSYECELCGKKFKQKQNLKQHLKTQLHAGENYRKGKGRNVTVTTEGIIC